MDEYICKNSVRQKPFEVKLFEYNMEWQCGEKKGMIPYANIVSVNLSKLGNKFTTRIESDYQGEILLSNRFYLSNGEYEDRSRQYNIFVRLLHLHLGKQKTTRFFTGTSIKKLFLLNSMLLLLFVAVVEGLAFLIGDAKEWEWKVVILFFFVIGTVGLCQLPKTYSGNEIPMHYLPSIRT